MSGAWPCLGCGRFKCRLGQAHCDPCAEMHDFGHKAVDCPERIEASTYAEEAYVHGRCK